MSFDDFSDFPVADAGHGAAPSASPSPPSVSLTPQDNSAYLGHIKALLDVGATGDQIRSYVQAQRLDPSLIQGLDDVIAYRDQGGKDYQVTPIGGQPAAPQPDQPKPDEFSDFPEAQPEQTNLGAAERGVGLAARDVIRAGGQIGDLLSAPLHIIDKIDQAITPNRIRPGMDSVSDVTNTLADNIGLPTEQTDSERLQGSIATGMAGGAMTLGMAAPFAAESPLAAAMTNAPVAEIAAGGGAGGGAEVARQEGFGPWAQIGAALVGGLAGGGGVTAASKAAGLRPSNRVLGETGQAFDRQDVRMLPAMTGRTGPQMATGVTHMTLGGIPLADAAEQSILSARAARSRIAKQIGAPAADTTGVGLAVQRGAKSFIETSEARGNKLYEQIPIAPAKPGILSNTKNALADLNAGLESNAELSGLIADPRLKAYQNALEGKTEQISTGILDGAGNAITRAVQKGGQLSWGDLKAFRSYIGELAGRPTLQDSTAQGALKRLYAGLSEDMQATAAADGPKSLAAFNRANTFWRARQDRIDKVLSQVLGPKLDKGGQATFNQIESWARNKGDAIKLGQMLRSLPEDEASTVRASVFDRLGDVSAGRQGASGDVFSPNDFLTHWNSLSDRAKSTLFPGIDYRSDIDDMVRIAGAMKDANKYANVSRTSLGTNAVALLGAFFSNPLYAIGMAGTEFGAGKMLASQKFAHWLASAPRKPNGPAALAHINRLSTIAAAEPAISNEVLRLQEQLASAFRTAPMKAAANPDSQGAPQGYMGFSYAQPGSPDTNEATWDKRADGSAKGHGYLGLLQRPGGGVSSEISIGVDGSEVGSKLREVEIPTMVPTLTKDELNALLTKPEEWVARSKDPVARSITQKARDYARHRIAMGMSPFAQSGESPGSQGKQ